MFAIYMLDIDSFWYSLCTEITKTQIDHNGWNGDLLWATHTSNSNYFLSVSFNFIVWFDSVYVSIWKNKKTSISSKMEAIVTPTSPPQINIQI